MARSVRLDDMRTRVRRRADLVNATGKYPDATITDEVNESIAALYDRIRAARGQDYYEKTSAITTTASTATYNLPADFLEMIAVELSAGGVVTKLRPFTREERGPLASSQRAWDGSMFGYRIRGKTSYTANDIIEFRPTPATGSAVTLYYVPTAAKLVADSDTFDGIDGWEEYAILDCAAKLLTQENRLDRVATLRAERDVLGARIDGMASRRDHAGPAIVTDVRARPYGWRRTPWR